MGSLVGLMIMEKEPVANVDVVIPLYNGERYIAKALRSTLEQTLLPRTVTVVNDGSTDQGPRLVREMMASYNGPVQITCLSKPNGGLSSARNHGIAHGSADYVAFLDADDVWMPGKLKEQCRTFGNSLVANLGLVYCNYHVVGADDELLPDEPVVCATPALRGDVFNQLLQANMISASGSGVLVKRAVLAAEGGFDERLKAAEDWDLWLRLSRRCGFDYNTSDLVGIRRHAASMQHDRMHMLLNLLEFYIKWFDEARKRPEVLHYWSHVVAEFALRSKSPSEARAMVVRTLPAPMRGKLFRRTGGSLRLHMWIKQLRSPRK